jgi:hypothetical protein
MKFDWTQGALAEGLRIPTGIVYDKDSSDFRKGKRPEEEAHNAQLDALANAEATVRVWRLMQIMKSIFVKRQKRRSSSSSLRNLQAWESRRAPG